MSTQSKLERAASRAARLEALVAFEQALAGLDLRRVFEAAEQYAAELSAGPAKTSARISLKVLLGRRGEDGSRSKTRVLSLYCAGHKIL